MQRFDVWNFDIMRSEFMYTNWTYWTDIEKNKNLLCPTDTMPRHHTFAKYNYMENA